MKYCYRLIVSVMVTLFLMLFQLCALGQDTLLIIHPTADNIRLIDRLIRDGIFPLENYHLLGVYHEDEAYDYGQASELIRLNHIERFSLVEVTGHLDAPDIFSTNKCSGQFAHLFAISRGALFFGGPDIPPLLYDEPAHLLTRVTDPSRHFFEVSFLFHLLGGSRDPAWEPLMESRETYLVSGICLGMQTMVVATGGTLVQDIPTEIYGVWTAEQVLSLPAHQQHRNYEDLLSYENVVPTSYHFHPVRVEKGSFLDSGDYPGITDPLVLSSHHQGIETTGDAWRVVATSIDGKVIEAIQHTRYPHVFGVQFHPEKPGLFDPSVLHAELSGDSASFAQTIRDNYSYDFHLNYWKAVAAPLLNEE
jgi:putative glutamine amidotransferase